MKTINNDFDLGLDVHQKKNFFLRSGIILHLLAMLLPILIMGTAFALHGIYPFGDRQILVSDFWSQYYPFLSDYWHKLRNGNSLLWSWTSGAGHDYVAHIAYYLASPLNLLIALFPHSLLREVITGLLLVKIGMAGLFMSLYLRFSLKKYDAMLPVFSTLYALCAFTLGYYWNIMWFDTFAVFPLVMLGVHSLVHDGKYRLYIASLAMAVFFNFYIGLFVCIFVVIMFLMQCYITKQNLESFIRKLVIISICSIIAIGLTAIITLPTFSALQNTYDPARPIPALALHTSFANVLGNFIAFTPPTSLNGLPNLYSGMISAMLLPIFLLSKKISMKEKIAFTSAFVFMILSVNINVLDFIWSGFRTTNMIPFRFAFLSSFILVTIAYKAYLIMDEVKLHDVIIMAASAAIFLLMAAAGTQETVHILLSAGLSLIYLILFLIAATIYKKGHIFKFILCLVIVAELSGTAFNGVGAVGTTSRALFPQRFEQVQELLTKRQTEDPDFFRTEMARWWSINDPSMYGFNGISFFSSLANVNTINFMQELGIRAHDLSNVFYYAETSPLTNAFLNIRYLVSRDGWPTDDGIFWDRTASVRESVLLRNNRYLPFGFMVNGDIVNYVGDRGNPFNSQNNLFHRSTGLYGSLFTALESILYKSEVYNTQRIEAGEYSFSSFNGSVRFYYQMPFSGPLYVYTHISGSVNARVIVNDATLHSFNKFRPYIFFAGYFTEGEIVGIEADTHSVHGLATIHVGLLNRELFDHGFTILSAETLELTQFTDTIIAGNVNVAERKLLYTSLPHAGNWRVFVNGERCEIVTIGGVMAAVWLDPGENAVEFRFHNTSFNVGVGISILSLFLFIILVCMQWKGINAFEFAFEQFTNTKNQREKAMYLLFGGITTFLNWGVYTFAVQFLSISVSNLIAWVLAVIFAFTVNKMWVFGNRNWNALLVLTQAGTFLSARLVTGLIEIVGVPLLVFIGLSYPLFGIEGFAAKMTVSIFVIILNYIFSKTFVFNDKRS